MKKVYHVNQKAASIEKLSPGIIFFTAWACKPLCWPPLYSGANLLQLADTKLIITIVVIQLVAIPGAYGVSRLSEKFGNLRVLTGTHYFLDTDLPGCLLYCLF